MDADSLRSRFRVLVPIYLGPIHVLACAWWAVGTWQLPNFWSPSFHAATASAPASITIASWSGHSVVTAFNATAYNSDLLKHWVGWYPGAPKPLQWAQNSVHRCFSNPILIVSGGMRQHAEAIPRTLP